MNRSRHTIRLQKFDYSSSQYYFITICSYNRECIFGEINYLAGISRGIPERKSLFFAFILALSCEVLSLKIKSGKIILNENGRIIGNIWHILSKRFYIKLDAFQIMPNHVHFVIHIVGEHHDAPEINKRAIHESPLQNRSLLSQIVGYYKMNTSKLIHGINPNLPVWQRNYYEHIIRNENELEKIREYILVNPIKWDLDNNNPKNIKPAY